MADVKYYALFDGPDKQLASEELTAVLESSGISANPSRRCGAAFFEATWLEPGLHSRLALTKELGEFLGSFDSLADAVNCACSARFGWNSFKVDSQGFEAKKKLELDSVIGQQILRSDSRKWVDLQKPAYVVRLVKLDDEFLVGITRQIARRWVERRPRARPFFHPVAIFPKLARVMVNLSRPKVGRPFFDPCAGTGSLLLEATEMGFEALGMDKSKKMVFGCRRNLLHFVQTYELLLMGDASRPPIREAGAIATDLPYGRASPTGGTDIVTLRERILDWAEELLAKGGCIVVMTPSASAPSERRSLRLLSQHDLYVHRSLTRRISVFRRV
jgi:tRNA (guanine10-N2)-dimethyltransferase